jgi:DNA-binding SARP family transcriptional activator
MAHNREPLLLGLLNGFELRRRDGEVSLPLSAQRLLAFLALRRRPALRVYVAGALWTDSSEERANASLRSALWRLQRAARTAVRASSTHLAIAPDLRLDVDDIARLAQRCIGRGEELSSPDAERLCRSGDVLPDWYDEWLVMDRERFRHLRLHALDALCQALTAARRFGEAAQVGVAAIASEPLRESAHRALIGVHLAEGNIAEAMRQFDACRELFRARIGMEPSLDLHRMMARGFEDAGAGRPRAASLPGGGRR